MDAVMNTRELVELAALIASQGPLCVSATGRISESGLQDYWTASKCRFDRWGRALRSFSLNAQEHGPHWAQMHAFEVQPVIEEVLASEILTRVWSAIVAAHPPHGKEDALAITRSVYLGHLEARNRVLHLLAGDLSPQSLTGQSMNYLRRRCESWTDMLIGYLLGTHGDVSEFAFNRQRAWDFHESLDHQRHANVGYPAWQLTFSSLKAAFRHLLCSRAANGDLNHRLAAGIVCCYPPEQLEDVDLLRRLWLSRLQHTAADTAGLIEELLRYEAAEELRIDGSETLKPKSPLM